MKERIAKDAGTAIFWKVLQQGGVNIIFMVRLLILARLLVPEDFGLMAIAMTAIGFLLRITDFGMIPALVQRSDVSEKHYNAAWTVGVMRAATIGGIVLVAAPLIAGIFAEPRAVNIIRVIALLPVIEAAASIKIAELTRHLQFRPLSIAKLSDALTNMIISISLASSLGVWALVAGTLAGPMAYMILSYILAPHHPRFALNRDAAKALIRFGQWIFLTSLIAISGAAVLRIVISRKLGVAELGLYFLAAKLAFLPSELASEVVGSVAFPLYARLQKNIGQTVRAFRAIFSGMLIILTPLSVLLIVLAPSLVENLLGDRWNGTVHLIQLLTTIGLLGLIADATVPVLKGIGKPAKFAAIEGIQSILLILFAWSFTSSFGLIGAALAWFPATIGTVIAAVVFLYQSLEDPFAGLKSPLAAVILASAAGAVVAFYLVNLIPGLLGLIAAGLLAGGSIAVLLWFSDQRFEIGLANDFARAFPQAASLLKKMKSAAN